MRDRLYKVPAKCIVEDCGDEVYAKNLCQYHYRKSLEINFLKPKVQ